MNIADALLTAESYIDEETGEPNLYHVDRDVQSVAETIEALLALREVVIAADYLANLAAIHAASNSAVGEAVGEYRAVRGR
jgi:hypothetical protein